MKNDYPSSPSSSFTRARSERRERPPMDPRYTSTPPPRTYTSTPPPSSYHPPPYLQSRPTDLSLNNPNLLGLALGQFLGSAGSTPSSSTPSTPDPRLHEMECEISKLRLDLKQGRDTKICYPGYFLTLNTMQASISIHNVKIFL
eukprot:sb/3473999/